MRHPCVSLGAAADAPSSRDELRKVRRSRNAFAQCAIHNSLIHSSRVICPQVFSERIGNEQSPMRKLEMRPGMLLCVCVGPALYHPTFPHCRTMGFLRRPSRSESRARGPVARSAEKKRKACAFIEDFLPRGWPHTLVGEGSISWIASLRSECKWRDASRKMVAMSGFLRC